MRSPTESVLFSVIITFWFPSKSLLLDTEDRLAAQILRLLQRTFTAHEYQVFTTTSAVDTLEALAQYRPDLLLLGLDGTGRSGREICQQVRAQLSLPIIVLYSRHSKQATTLQASPQFGTYYLTTTGSRHFFLPKFPLSLVS